ncbi:hypothetical protein QCD70_01075 [Agreia sp. PsM10]|uniref:hypothetical protein n=1 Tax=Agreia sp. PsM10 TaxID=3030533 RepID=UPI00263BAB50|nr:hypothetical protein [Agreia sp. PsM10]MDN4638825.1 hypothetical protein [Agreia sp. PsM10]
MEDTVALWIQAVAVVVAIATGVIAIILGVVDRRNTRRVAEQDRAFTRLMVEREQLAKLLENYNKGGSSDPEEASRMGSEALTLIGLIGERRLPYLWASHIEGEAALRLSLDDPDMPDWKKDAIRVQIAVIRNQDDIGTVAPASE